MAQHGSYRWDKEKAKSLHSDLRDIRRWTDNSERAERQSRHQCRLKDMETVKAGRSPGRSSSEGTDRDQHS